MAALYSEQAFDIWHFAQITFKTICQFTDSQHRHHQHQSQLDFLIRRHSPLQKRCCSSFDGIPLNLSYQLFPNRFNHWTLEEPNAPTDNYRPVLPPSKITRFRLCFVFFTDNILGAAILWSTAPSSIRLATKPGGSTTNIGYSMVTVWKNTADYVGKHLLW